MLPCERFVGVTHPSGTPTVSKIRRHFHFGETLFTARAKFQLPRDLVAIAVASPTLEAKAKAIAKAKALARLASQA